MTVIFRTNQTSAMSGAEVFGAMQHSVPCNVVLGGSGSLMPARWPFTKVAKTCGKFSLLPSLITGWVIFSHPWHFSVLVKLWLGEILEKRCEENDLTDTHAD